MRQNKTKNKYTAFKSKYPKLHFVNTLIAMLLPVGFVCFFAAIFKVVDGREVLFVYSLVGSLVLGGGLTLYVAVDYDKEVFWRLNVYPITIGALITFGSIFCACGNVRGIAFDENILEFQLCCYLFVFWILLSYFISREAMTDYITSKTGLKENQLNKRKEGFFNYLWYRKIHKESGIGWIYYFNVFFTIILFLFLVGTILLAFLENIANIVMLLSLIAALFSIIFELFALFSAVKNKKSYCKSSRISLLGKVPYFFEIASIAIILLFIWLQIKNYLQ